MENTEMVLQEPTVLPQKSESEQIAELLRVMQGMAQMIRATHDRMAALEAQVRHLTKVTPAQATGPSTKLFASAQKRFAANTAQPDVSVRWPTASAAPSSWAAAQAMCGRSRPANTK